MAWKEVSWACGHSGSMQLFGSRPSQLSRVSHESGKKCMACWILEQWEEKNDPRILRENAQQLARDIAEDKGILIREGGK